MSVVVYCKPKPEYASPKFSHTSVHYSDANYLWMPIDFPQKQANNLLNAIGFFDSIVEQLRKMVKLLSSYSSRLVLKTSHSIRFTKIIYPFHLSGMLYIANGIAFLRSQPSTKNIIQFQYVWCILLKFHGKANIELACEKKTTSGRKKEQSWNGEARIIAISSIWLNIVVALCTQTHAHRTQLQHSNRYVWLVRSIHGTCRLF